MSRDVAGDVKCHIAPAQNHVARCRWRHENLALATSPWLRTMSRDIADDMALAMSPWLRTMSRDVAGDMRNTGSRHRQMLETTCRDVAGDVLVHGCDIATPRHHVAPCRARREASARDIAKPPSCPPQCRQRRCMSLATSRDGVSTWLATSRDVAMAPLPHRAMSLCDYAPCRTTSPNIAP